MLKTLPQVILNFQLVSLIIVDCDLRSLISKVVKLRYTRFGTDAHFFFEGLRFPIALRLHVIFRQVKFSFELPGITLLFFH